MSQSDFGNLDPAITSGDELAIDVLNPWRDALNSLQSGSTRPAYAQEGLVWMDTSNPRFWKINQYNGVNDVLLFEIDTTTETTSQDDHVDITGYTFLAGEIARFARGTINSSTDNLRAVASSDRRMVVGKSDGDGFYRDNFNKNVWVAIPDLLNNSEPINGITWSEPIGKFVVVGDNNEVKYSADGITWTSTDPVVYQDILSALTLNDFNGTNKIMVTSINGITSWTSNGSSWVTTVVVDWIGVRAYCSAYSFKEQRVIIAGSGGNAAYSDDGVLWGKITNPFSGYDINSICYSEPLERWIIVGVAGPSQYTHVAYSDDSGVTWTELTNIFGDFLTVIFTSVACVEESHHFLAVGYNTTDPAGGSGRLAISLHGDEWTRTFSSIIEGQYEFSPGSFSRVEWNQIFYSISFTELICVGTFGLLAQNQLGSPSATTEAEGVVFLATPTENISGQSDLEVPTVKGIREGFNAPGLAPVFACRGAVTFTLVGGVPTIESAKNVLSITDLGVGRFLVNIEIALPDRFFHVIAMSSDDTTASDGAITTVEGLDANRTTTSIEIQVRSRLNAPIDPTRVNVIIF